jgi:hypothetical protein
MVLVILKVSWLAAEISSIECFNSAIDDFAWLAPRLEEKGFLIGPHSPSQRVGRSAPGDWTPAWTLSGGVGRAPASREKTVKVLSQFADREHQQSIMRMIIKGRQRNPTSIVSPAIPCNDRSAGQNP